MLANSFSHIGRFAASALPQAVGAVMLMLALDRNPYAYYVLLRWVCCPILAFLAVRAANLEKIGWTWVLGISALIYNPIMTVHLNREIWSVLNVVTIIILGASVWPLRHKPTQNGPEGMP